ncbi:titin homolog [Asterias rubens]|uniref:titin homolog n=1 Tax=Asterias rubens TaxID=7604 RepID=UPI0014555EB6|nr:titin homolog [Asterias rubens]
MASTNAGLSLLARGIGEERVRRGHKKLEVCLEPEDYHNIGGRKFYLPPIQQKAWPQEELVFDSPRELHTHKTFTTRKGALLLYSEDLAMTAKEKVESTKALEAEDSNSLNTFNDLRSAILSYGAKDSTSEPVYLGFVHNKHSHNSPRTIRPGFSAKRYLSSWSRSWDDSVLLGLRTNGHILDKNLFQENALSPKILRRINDDLSSLPAPYRVTRSMLMAPGSPIVYEFYRIRPRSADSGRPSEDDFDNDKDRTPIATLNVPGSIAAVVRDDQNKPRAVPYSSLARDEQQQVLQRLLLQSAMHEQLMNDADKGGVDIGSTTSMAGSRPVTVEQLRDLNMVHAVAALVNTNTSGLMDGQQAFDDKGYKDLYKRKFNQTFEPSPPAVRKGINRSGHRSKIPTIPTLPPILSTSPIPPQMEKHTLRAETKLPQITMEPPTPQHPVLGSTHSRKSSSWGQDSEDMRDSWPSDETNIWKADIDEDELLKQQEAEQEDSDEEELLQSETKTKSAKSSDSNVHRRVPSKSGSILSSVSVSLEDLTGPIISGGKHPSGSEKSYGGGSSSEHSRSIKGSHIPGSLRESMRSYKGSKNSNSGSIVLGPDGEVMSIGGGVGSSADAGSSVADATENLQASSMAHSTHMGELESLDERDELEDDALSEDSGHMSSEEVEVHDPTPQPVMIPTAQFGADLPESKPPSLPSVPLSRMNKSQKSVEESLPSGKDVDLGRGDIDASRSFANFSYGPESAADDALSQDGIDDNLIEHAGSEDVLSEAEPGWPTEFGEQEVNDLEVNEGDMEGEDGTARSAAQSKNDDVASQRAPSQLEELEDHAATVAALVLERPKSGRDLAEDAEYAAELWMKKLGDLFNQSGDPDRIRSAMVRRRRNSLDASSIASSTDYGQWTGPSMKKTTKTKTKKRTSRRQRRIQSAEAAVSYLKNLMRRGGDESGDAVSVRSGKSGPSVKTAGARGDSAPSVKSDKSGTVKSNPSAKGDAGGALEFGVKNYGVADKAEQEKQAPVVRPAADSEKPQAQNTEDEELAKLLAETGLLEKDKVAAAAKSVKSGKSNKSNKSNNGSKEENKKEFVVKKPQDDKVDHLLYKPVPDTKADKAEAKASKTKKAKKTSTGKKPAAPKKGKKKPKDGEVKEEVKAPPKEEPPQAESTTTKPEEEKDVDFHLKHVQLPQTPEIAEDFDEEDEEPIEEEKPESPEFIIIHDEFSDSGEEEPDPIPPSVAQTDITVDSEIMSVYTEDSSSQGPSSVSRSQAKAAKRAAEAEKRKQAVERKRKEREDAKRKQQEELERQEKMKRDWEEEKRRKEEGVRMKREQEILERQKREQEAEERKRQQALNAEREKKRMEEYKRKMEEVARHKREEDERRKEENLRKQKEEDEKRKAEEAMLSAMHEEERLEYERKKREEELIKMRLEEEERLKREILARLAQEEAERFALELARRQKEMEARLMFNKTLHSENNILSHSQEMTPAFTWSYFELLEYLGIALPEHLKQQYKSDAASGL